jgi:DnaD/phage-associated family protein
MKWIEVDSGLINHPKIINLSGILHIKRSESVGIMVMLWCWSSQYAPDGDLSKYNAQTICSIIDCADREPLEVISALKSSGFLNDDMNLHNWAERQKYLLDYEEKKKVQTRERVRKHRENKSKDVTRYSNASNVLPVTECNAVTPYTDTVTYTNNTVSVNSNSTVSDSLISEVTGYVKERFKRKANAQDTEKYTHYLNSSLTVELIKLAIDMSAEKGKTNLFVFGILKHWLADGYKTVADLPNYKKSDVQNCNGSFDTDEFFDLAIKRSQEKMGNGSG